MHGHQQSGWNSNGATAVIIRSPTRVLLVKQLDRANALWKFPAGSLERGESVADAARREGNEETGVDLSDVLLQHVREDDTIDGTYVPHVCIADVSEQRLDTFKKRTDDDGHPLMVAPFSHEEVPVMMDLLRTHRSIVPFLLQAA